MQVCSFCHKICACSYITAAIQGDMGPPGPPGPPGLEEPESKPGSSPLRKFYSGEKEDLTKIDVSIIIVTQS